MDGGYDQNYVRIFCRTNKNIYQGDTTIRFSKESILDLLRYIANNFDGSPFNANPDDAPIDDTTALCLNHLKEHGYVTGTIAGDYTIIHVRVTPKGWEYLKENTQL